jgi:hypothetical protein
MAILSLCPAMPILNSAPRGLASGARRVSHLGVGLFDNFASHQHRLSRQVAISLSNTPFSEQASGGPVGNGEQTQVIVSVSHRNTENAVSEEGTSAYHDAEGSLMEIESSLGDYSRTSEYLQDTQLKGTNESHEQDLHRSSWELSKDIGNIHVGGNDDHSSKCAQGSGFSVINDAASIPNSGGTGPNLCRRQLNNKTGKTVPSFSEKKH